MIVNVIIPAPAFSLCILLSVVFLQACQQQPEPVIAVTPRDTTISIKEAFSRLTLDSTVVEGYLSEHPQMSDTAQQLFRNFYNSRNFQYAWFDENGRTEHAGMIWNLYQQYLEYTRDTVRTDRSFDKQMQRVFSGDTIMTISAEKVQRAELELTHLFFDYTFAAYIGTTRPEELQWYIPRRKINVISLLDSVLTSNTSTRDWEPVHPQYRLLRNQLIYFNRLQEAGGWPLIDTMKIATLREGMKDPRVLQIKKRLQAVGSYPVEDSSLIFTSGLSDSIKIIQQTFGLVPDGVVGKSTVEALNISPAERIKQLLINLERVRWLPRQPVGDWLLVNIPSFRLQVFRNDSSVLQMKIVVGNAATRTVIFSGELKYIVFSPYWNVPSSIVRNEILPAVRRNPGYLSRMRMEKTGISGDLPVIRQLPGPGNALGQVKFMFPNA